jgi:hypothetical protein
VNGKKVSTSTTSSTYNLSERGGGMKGVPVISNYIEINGEDVLMDTLSEEKRKQFAVIIQDKMMEAAGYKRNTA